MPTVLLLDVSLSMCRPVPMPDSAEPYQVRHLAVHGMNALLDHMMQHCKLEFTALVSRPSEWSSAHPLNAVAPINVAPVLGQSSCPIPSNPWKFVSVGFGDHS